MTSKPSSFLHPGTHSTAKSLAILHLRRDSLLPVFLQDEALHDTGYAEGCVTNTRFGSYPHSTLIGLEWGSQVLASKVDTGSRGRKSAGVSGAANANFEQCKQSANDQVKAVEEIGGDKAWRPVPELQTKRNNSDDKEAGHQLQSGVDTESPRHDKKRSVDEFLADDETAAFRCDPAVDIRTDKKQKIFHMHVPSLPRQQETIPLQAVDAQKEPIAASSGFCHILPPTPESWTISLPHRTQVVYTPDYSYILQKLRVRPGSVVIEAGAGSGSFTHAAARAAYNGYGPPKRATDEGKTQKSNNKRFGKVYSFEYHEPRVQQLQEEIVTHGLTGLVQLTHRDVYRDGFNLPALKESASDVPDISTEPDPSNAPITSSTPSLTTSPQATSVFLDLPSPWLALPHLTRTPSSPNSVSPLDPTHPVHLGAFLPCIEQVQRTVHALRAHGWVELSMQELAHRRIDVRRERVGLDLQGLRGVNASPATVDESVSRLLAVEKGGRAARGRGGGTGDREEGHHGKGSGSGQQQERRSESKAARLARIAREAESRKPWKEGRVVHRTEPDLKTHTSYLIFAVLPRAWSEEDERAARERWPVGRTVEVEDVGRKSKRR